MLSTSFSALALCGQNRKLIPSFMRNRTSDLQQRDGFLRRSSLGHAGGSDLPAVPERVCRKYYITVRALCLLFPLVTRLTRDVIDVLTFSFLLRGQILYHYASMAMATTCSSSSNRGRTTASASMESKGSFSLFLAAARVRFLADAYCIACPHPWLSCIPPIDLIGCLSLLLRILPCAPPIT